MPPRIVVAALVFLCCGPVVPAQAAGTLPPQVEQTLQRERVPLDALSVVVLELATGTTRVSLNARTPVNPASVAKLLTTYAALDELGPAFTWKTPVWFGGPLRGGVLEGSLHLQGRGDPKLSLERLVLLMQRLRQMGVFEIRGDIVIDQGAFLLPEVSTAEFDNEPLRPYNAQAQALLLNLNSVLYTFTPDASRGVALVSAEPALDGVVVDATVPLSAGPCSDWRGALKASLGEPQRLRFGGAYPAACGERVWALGAPDARQYTQRLLATLWRDAGGKLGGTVREGPAPQGVAPVFELTSPSLAEVVRDINKHSNNVMAQQLFLTLPLQRNGAAHATPDDARDLLRRWLVERVGESPEAMRGMVLDNGSGLSRQTRLPAALLARLLQRAFDGAVMPELMASLPVSGVDGTLRRWRAGPGRAHLKSGSLRDVQALAGYVLGASGKRYALVAIVNHPNAGATRPALDALVQWTMDDLKDAGAR